MQKNKDVVARVIQDQIVLVPISFSAEGLFAFHLDETGSFLWNCLDESTDPEFLAERLQAEYEIDAATAAQDVKQFLNDLQESKILL
jgi:hypothetical protein